MDQATSGGWNTSPKRKCFLIATVTVGYLIIIYNAPHKEVVVNETARRNEVRVCAVCDGACR